MLLPSIQLVRNAIATTALGFDTKNFTFFNAALTQDVTLIYPPPLTTVHGIAAALEMINSTLGHLVTSHDQTSQTIVFDSPSQATAMTYVIAHHWLNDRYYISSGINHDILVRQTCNGRECWRIRQRSIDRHGQEFGDPTLLGNCEIPDNKFFPCPKEEPVL